MLINIISIEFRFRLVEQTKTWDEYTNLARQTLFRLDKGTANAFALLMVRLTEFNQMYPSEHELAYFKSIFMLVNGSYTEYNMDKASDINKIFIHAFAVSVFE